MNLKGGSADLPKIRRQHQRLLLQPVIGLEGTQAYAYLEGRLVEFIEAHFHAAEEGALVCRIEVGREDRA